MLIICIHKLHQYFIESAAKTQHPNAHIHTSSQLQPQQFPHILFFGFFWKGVSVLTNYNENNDNNDQNTVHEIRE